MPISITRVYTRTGDKGETSLVGGKRIPKDSPRIVAYGTVDELNAVVGLVRVFNAERLDEGERHRWLDEVLRKIQNQLFDLGSELATPPDAVYEGMFRVGEGEVKELEGLMARCQKDLAPLKSFILPGGGRIHGFLHQARTVCRRAERGEEPREHQLEPVQVGGLVDVLDDPELARFDLRRRAVVTRGQDDGQTGLDRPKLSHEITAGHVEQMHVDDREAEAMSPGQP